MNLFNSKLDEASNEIEVGVKALLDQSKGLVDSLGRKDVSAQLEKLQEQLSNLGNKVKSGVKTVDNHVHDMPYAYLAGAFGVGFVAAKLLKFGKEKNCAR